MGHLALGQPVPRGVSTPRTETLRYDGNGRLGYASGPFSTKTLVSSDDRTDYLNYTYDASATSSSAKTAT